MRGRPGQGSRVAAAAEPADDPTLLDELPLLGDTLTNAPDELVERLLALFDLRAVYNRDKHQLTVRATLTDGTLQALRDLMDDPRADHNQLASGPPDQTCALEMRMAVQAPR